MRIDYILYVIAIVCFIAAASITMFQAAETQLWIVTLAILGFIFLGIGYLQKPAETAIIESTPEIAQAAATVEKPTIVEKTTVTVETPMSQLTQVKGIGAKRAEQLKDLGINSVEDLANASAKELAAKLKISPKITKRWITNAKELTKKS
jgi:predicted flap endonuclease-1-like 5' DNA nuclease